MKVKIKTIFSLSILQGANYIAPLLILPYLANTLGSSTFGDFALAISISQIFIIITDYGFNLTGSKDASLLKNNKKELTLLYSTITTIKAAFLVGGFIITTPIYLLVSPFKNDPQIYISAYAIVLGSAIFPLWIFQGTEHLKGAMIAMVIGRMISIAGVFTLVHTASDAGTAGLLYGSSGIIAYLLSRRSLKHLLAGEKFTYPSIENIKLSLKNGLNIFLSNLYINSYTTSNSIMLGLLQDPKSAGYFHLAEKFTKIAIFIFQPITQAFYPKVCIAAKEGVDKLIEINKLYLKITLPAAIVLSLLMIALSETAIEMLFDNTYAEVSIIIKLLAVLPIINVLSHSLSTLTLIPTGESKIFSQIYLAACFFNIPIFATLSLKFSGAGAAVANVLTETAVLTLLIMITIKKNISPITKNH